MEVVGYFYMYWIIWRKKIKISQGFHFPAQDPGKSAEISYVYS